MKAITHQLTLRRFVAAILCILALPLIHFVSRSNYNLFHGFADGASIVIAASTFTIIWNSRHRVNNDYFLFTGIAFLFFSFLDVMHLLGNKDMGIFPAYGNLGPTFYIASRYLLSVSLLCAPLFIHRRLKAPVVLGAYALVCALVVLSVFYWKVFPVCIVEGVGLTPFKVVSDYIICLILAGSIVLLLRHRESFDPRVLRIIVSSIVLSIATGLTFTLYTDPFGITNMMGHLFQLASFYMVYIAFIETSLTKPHEILFRELKQNEEKLIQNLRKLDDANMELNQEIAERKLAVEGLRQNREWLRVTLSSIGDAVVAADTEGRVTFLNPVAEEITGWELEEAIGTPVRNVFRTIDEETRLPGEDIVGRVLREGCIVNLANHTALITSDGREIPIEDSAAPIRDSAGNLIGVVLVFHDVAEKRRAQEALRKAHDELEWRVRERTSALNATVARLELMNQELQEFAFVASHDLQEPLRKIQTFCDMARNRCAPELDTVSQGYLEKVLNSAARMRQLLDDLLQFSRVATRPKPFKEIDLGKIARESADIFEAGSGKAASLVEIENMPTIEADETQMLRLFQNLIGNALKFCSNHPPQVQVYARNDGQGSCEIFVKDNGIGFDQQFAERIFKPFQRLHTRKEYEGTGMGLAICRKIAERHEGNIRAESEPGKGSTFIIRLPIKQHRWEGI